MRLELDILIGWFACRGRGGGGGTPLLGLYRDMPLDRVWFFGLAGLNRVDNFTRLCTKEGQNLSHGTGITSQEMLMGHDKVINQHKILFWTRLLLWSLNILFHFSVL